MFKGAGIDDTLAVSPAAIADLRLIVNAPAAVCNREIVCIGTCSTSTHVIPLFWADLDIISPWVKIEAENVRPRLR